MFAFQKKNGNYMNKNQKIIVWICLILLAVLIYALVMFLKTPQRQEIPFQKKFSVTNASGLSFETNAPYESITTSNDGWTVRAGGENDSTHYARIKYKLPEQAGMVLTRFYFKAVIVLPADFYEKHQAGFRIMNTDNFTANLNGTMVGASDANESRCGIFLWNSDQRLHFRCEHETLSDIELYTSPGMLSVGEHIIELYGDVSKVAPWYLRIDGAEVASGKAMLSASDVSPSERVITRFVVGIDGAADQDANPMELMVKSFEIANFEPNQ
ncbi:MAG: hypothetical protein U0Z26_16160 [Anaerolineales bacterium]